ncbi:MAG TPA: poly-gamma-glutamate hydrolase family protein [Vicinamibacterales bacterium]|nr:poly-gamma-glutamate hydrolase family protein [Vicinamibacterales bacterium]
MPPGPDFYPSMTALYQDPDNLEGTTYGKRWLRHQWQQIIEEQSTDNAETQKLVMAIHGGGIEAGTSEIALATAGFNPATLMPSADGLGIHDFWLFEGLLPRGNGRLHVTASNYDDPIATELVRNANRCISLHGCTDRQANGRIQLGGLDIELRDIVLEALTAAHLEAEIATNPLLDGSRPDNVANKTRTGGCAQLEMGTSFRSSLFGINTRPRRRHTTTDTFRRLVSALRRAMNRVA